MIGHVQREGLVGAATIECRELVAQCADGGLVAVGGDDARAFPGKGQSRGATDASPGTR
jgi:hypothetical protein